MSPGGRPRAPRLTADRSAPGRPAQTVDRPRARETPANPKIGIFFTSLLPQFVTQGHSVLLPFLLLGAIVVLMTVTWLAAYTMVAARIAATLQRPRMAASQVATPNGRCSVSP